MLVLTRKIGEAITLPSMGVTIHVVAVRGHRVTLGISAPSAIRVLRGELPRNDAPVSPVCSAERADPA